MLANQLEGRIGRHGINALRRPGHPKSVSDYRGDLLPRGAGPLAPVLQVNPVRWQVHRNAADASGRPPFVLHVSTRPETLIGDHYRNGLGHHWRIVRDVKVVGQK